MVEEGSNFTIPPLISGGLMLSYRCTNACRHCLYRCSPKAPNEWITLETAEKAFQALSQEPQLDAIHISGGEATLKIELLLDVIRLAQKTGVPLSYLETNAAWCTNHEKAVDGFRRMSEAGLPAVLVSASMFHNEFVPFIKTRTAVEAAREVFGRHGVIVWLPNLYEAVERMGDHDQTHSLEEFCRRTGLESRMDVLPRLYHLVPGGRVPDAMRECYLPKKAEVFRNFNCLHQLTGTTHFHIDHYGHLFTGLCAGIVAGTVDDLHPAINEKTKPVVTMLCRGGPHALMQWAVGEYGYEEKPESYVSECDLCIDVRRHLKANGDFPELQPDFYYAL
jgi:hypothetical protein